MAAIHQFLAGFKGHDAISNESLVIRDIFRSWGYESNIFSEPARVASDLHKDIFNAADLAATCKPDDTVLLHLSAGSIVNNIFVSLPCRKAILYHNITPPHYFDRINKGIAQNMAEGLEQVRNLAGSADVNMACSNYSASELTALGYSDIKILPLIIDFDKLQTTPDKRTLAKLNDGTTNVLFVGRCAPNKKIEDVIQAFYFFHEFIDPHSRLIHIGSTAGVESYYSILRTQVRDLDLDCVTFKGSVSQEILNALYSCADILLCMSEHEGFCIPLIESMFFDVPILAYAAAAVPETLDGTGVLFDQKDFREIAEMMGQLINNKPLRTSVIERQQKRLSSYRRQDLGVLLKQYLKPILKKGIA